MTFTITRPDSSQLLLTRSTDTSSVANGFVTQAELKNSSSASMAKTVFSYANDSGGAPQVQSIIGYDDASTPNQTKMDFDYDAYGNITNKREYGFQISGAWAVRRRTHTVYGTGYLTSHPTEVDVYDAQQDTNDSNDVLIAKTTYTYDDYAAMSGMEDYGGTASPPDHNSYYGTSWTTRGNVTGVTKWTDISANTYIQHLAKYDIFGNETKAQLSCCQEKDFTFTSNTNYGQVESVLSGDPSGTNETISDDPDFDTNLPNSATDAGGLTTSYGYNAALSVNSITSPVSGTSGAATFDYANLQTTQSATFNDNSQTNGGGTISKTVTAITNYDGWGRVIQTIDYSGAKVNTSYDALGRVTATTNPFSSTPGASTSYTYDALGRVTVTSLPTSDTVQANYSGAVVTLTDQVSRQTKRERDGLGRLIKVTEPDSSGTLNQDTTYSYSLLDQLTGVNQGGQTRSYKYDALGRLLFEKIPEQTATINDGSGTYWISKYTNT
jgi:YD repeat-containing protein